MTADESQQLAALAAVTEEADQVLDRLFASVEELKTLLGRTEAKGVTMTAPAPPPPPPPAGNEALETARALQGALEGMSADLKAVSGRLGSAEKGLRRSRHVIIALVISLILDVSLTIGVTVSTVQAHTASDRAAVIAQQLHSSQISACEVGNQLRAKQILPWQKLIALSSPSPGETAAQKRSSAKLLARFLAYVRSVYPRLDCNKLYRQ